MIKRIKTVSFMLLLLGLPVSAAYAETAPIETIEIVQQSGAAVGTVVDANGEALTGASVVVKGTTKGAMVDNDGRFSIAGVKAGDVLRITFIGYKAVEMKWEGQPLAVTLEEDNNTLDEVVVTALGIKRQSRSLGYSTTNVSGEDFAMARDANIGNALSGKIAGVSVSGNATGSTGSSRVVIRGNASLTGNNMPLYVIDGVPFDNSNQGSAGMWGGADMGDGLANINADDIESMQVLKGAAASALYGYRGGNGAILITTKSGKKGGVQVDVNENVTFNSIYDMRDYQKEFGLGSEGVKPTTVVAAKTGESASWGAYLDGSKAMNFLGNEYEYSYIDNWKHFYNTGVTSNSSVAISGGSDAVIYRFGTSYNKENSILPNAGNSQLGFNMNTQYKILSNLTATVTANYVFDKANGRSNLSDGNGNTNASLIHRGNSFDIRWMEGTSKGWGTNADGSEMIGGNNVYFNNPYWLQYRKTNEMDRNRFTGAVNLKWDITEWLYAQGAVQRDSYNMEYKQVQPIGAAADPSGYLSEYSKNFGETNVNFLLGFNKTWNDWSVGATFGGNRQSNSTKRYMVSDGGRPFVVDGLWSVNNLSDKRPAKEWLRYKVNSLYFTADFGWRNQVFLNVTGRNDWFSTLAPESNSYFYPSVTASWVFTDTFRDALPDWFGFGKLRAGYAFASNGTSPYQNILLYQLRNYTVNGQQVATQNNGNKYPNANLKPVKITEKEVGLNLSFFQNRLSFDMAYYIKNTSDDIAMVSTSSASGYSAAVVNVGELENRGFEFMVDAYPVRTGSFTWNTTFNFALNNSEVKYLGEGVDRLSIDGAQSRSGNVYIYNVVGSPYGEIIGNQYKRNANGELLLKNGLPQAGDQVSLGNGVYKFTSGWKNTFSYKGFALSFLLDAKFGAKIFSGTNYSLYSEGLHKETLNGRTKENALGKIVAVGIDEETGQKNTVAVTSKDYYQGICNANIGEEFVYDASFIKLRELSFGYDFKGLLRNTDWINGLTVSLVGRNLWTIMKHTPNIDPEASINNSNGQGLELNGYPITRNIGLNVNIKFGASGKQKAAPIVTKPQYVEKIVEKIVEKPVEKIVEKIVEKEVVREVAKGGEGYQSTYVVTFANSSSEIADPTELNGIAKGSTVEVVAYATPEGNADANFALSQQRANAVAEYLKAHGVNVVRTTAKGADTAHANRIAIVTVK